MSVAAQLAQNSKLYISSTAGAAKNITAVAVGFPTIITSTAHGLTNGDVVTIAAITGTIGTDATNGLNGKTFVIKNVTTNTFCIEQNTAGLAYTSGGTATPVAWTQIKEVKAIKPGGAQVTKVDVTDLDSTSKEYRAAGVVDNGTFAADVHILESDAGQTAAKAAFEAGTTKSCKITTGSKTRTFDAICTKWPTVPDASVDGVLTGSAEWQISGAVTVS